MYISQIFSIILFSFGAAASYLGFSAVRKQFRDYLGNSVLGMACFFSALWSYGFGMVFLTTEPTIAYWGRTIGMIGVFGYMIVVQILVGVLAKMPQRLYHYFCGFAFLGIILYLPIVSPASSVYYVDDWGMTYSFAPGLVNNLYSAYSVIYGINLCVSIGMILKTAMNKRSKVTGHKMLITLIIVFAGMIMDTILPMFGFGAIPGSSMSQFIGLLVMYYAIVDYNKTRLTVRNMSGYVYSSISEPVIVLTTDGYCKLYNKAAREMFAPKNAEGGDEDVSIHSLFRLPDDFLSYDGDHRTDDSSSINGNIPVQIQTSKIRDKYGDQIGLILAIRDMTEISRMMDSLVEAKRLADSNNIAKSAFLANMSHEIRTPLNAIVGFSELLLKSDISDENKEQVEDIRSSSHNLIAIINDVLDITKIESGKMELNETEYSISKVIKDSYLIIETLAAKKGLDFTMDIDPNIPSKLFGDPVRVRGLFVNILNNAVKYTREGSVKFTGVLDGVDEGVAKLRFEVTDTGIGIKEEDISKLFETFLQVDKKVNTGIEGTGLGLAIVKGFVELMGGDIDIKSVYGEGSTFILTIPQKIIDDTPIGTIGVKANKSGEKSSISDVKYTGVRVLGVDDNKVNSKVISKVLSMYDMDVTMAFSGMEAVELCKNNEYDIILMDQMMPGMDGVEAMHIIRTLSDRYRPGGDCIIIALTANAISGVKEQLVEEGFDDYLSKPLEIDKMEKMFSDFLNKKKG